jgi:hypothetical protein
MNRLEEIFYKSEHSSDKWQPYFEVYDRHLSSFIGKEITLVEVGVQKGGSLEMWSAYLGSQAKIIGIDVDPECSKLTYTQNNISVIIGDQGDPAFWDKFLSENKVDILIDDGGHYMNQQIVTLEKVYPTLPIGGIFICEDCHTSYMSGNGGGLENPNTFIEYSKSLVDVLNFNWKEQYTTKLDHRNKTVQDLTSVHFYDSMVVLEKFGKKEMKRVFAK